MPYPNVPKLLVAALADLGWTCTRLPTDLAARLPVIQFRRVGGGDDQVTDRPRIDVLVVAADEDAADTLSETIRARLTDRLVPVTANDAVLDEVSTETGPIQLPYPDQQLTQYLATYVCHVRRE